MALDYSTTVITNGRIIIFDYCTSTRTTTSFYFDQITNGTYHTGGTGDNYFNLPFQTVPPPRHNPEEIAIQEKARKEEEEEEEKARKLLLEYLDQDNKQRYLEKKPIEVFSKLFNDIKYQIPISKLDKISALKDGKVVSKLCLVVKEPEHIPLEDAILTKLLHFLNDEECTLKTANHSSVSENLLARLN